MKLANQAMLLLNSSLLLEILFVSVLGIALHQSEVELDRAEKARMILAETQRISACFFSVQHQFGQYELNARKRLHGEFEGRTRQMDENLAGFERSSKEAVDAIRTLMSLVQDDKEALASVAALDQEFAVGQSIIREYIPKIDSADKATFTILQLQIYRQSNRLLAIVHRLSDVLDRQKEVLSRSSSVRSSLRLQVQFLLCIGLAGHILLALLIARLFVGRVAAKLAVLSDNTSRFQNSQKLNSLLDGADELSALDAMFHEMAQKIEQSTSKLRALVELLPIGVFLCSRDSAIEYANAEACRLLGCVEGDIVGISWLDVFEIAGATSIGSSSPADFFQSMLNSSHPDLRRVSFRNSANLLMKGEISTASIELESPMILIAVRDISQKAQLEQAKQEFVAMVTHDLRTPLTNILGFVDLLIAGRYGEVPHELLLAATRSRKSTDSLIALVNDLLDLEKLDSGALLVNIENVSLQQLVEEAVSCVASLSEAKNVQIEFELLDVMVLADPSRIVQVLINLLGNSLKFSPEESKISISFDSQGEFLSVKIADQGRGIPVDKLGMLFERFRQIDPSDGRRGVGSGLGLAISKQIVEMHGGTIGARNNPEGGSIFWFTLRRSA